MKCFSFSARKREEIPNKAAKNVAEITLFSKNGSRMFPGIVFAKTFRYPVEHVAEADAVASSNGITG